MVALHLDRLMSSSTLQDDLGESLQLQELGFVAATLLSLGSQGTIKVLLSDGALSVLV